jgi:hypothetical protein
MSKSRRRTLKIPVDAALLTELRFAYQLSHSSRAKSKPGVERMAELILHIDRHLGEIPEGIAQISAGLTDATRF